jgi:probable HAF family extracellular repeat protein
MTDLGTLGGSLSSALAINERGQIVGASDTGATIPPGQPQLRAFLWERGTMQELGTLVVDGHWSVGAGINARGQVVGWDDSPTFGPVQLGWILDHGTKTRLLDVAETQPAAINDRGQVVGSAGPATAGRAFLWDDGVVTDLGTLGGPTSRANAINDRGLVVGASDDFTGVTRAFFWEDGTMTALGTLGGAFSSADAVNAGGTIAGVSATAGGAPRAVIWNRA